VNDAVVFNPVSTLTMRFLATGGGRCLLGLLSGIERFIMGATGVGGVSFLSFTCVLGTAFGTSCTRSSDCDGREIEGSFSGLILLIFDDNLLPACLVGFSVVPPKSSSSNSLDNLASRASAGDLILSISLLPTEAAFLLFIVPDNSSFCLSFISCRLFASLSVDAEYRSHILLILSSSVSSFPVLCSAFAFRVCFCIGFWVFVCPILNPPVIKSSIVSRFGGGGIGGGAGGSGGGAGASGLGGVGSRAITGGFGDSGGFGEGRCITSGFGDDAGERGDFLGERATTGNFGDGGGN